jgi:glucose-1-phosphate thymidylyltransferase
VLFRSIEITHLLDQYHKEDNLSAEILGRGGAWLDTGSMDDYYKTSMFVSAVENRQGVKIACLEEIALQNKWINKKKVESAIKFYGNCDYSKYLSKLI